MKELEASNVATARAIGVDETTIRRDLADSANAEPEAEDTPTHAGANDGDSANAEPEADAWFQADPGTAKTAMQKHASRRVV